MDIYDLFSKFELELLPKEWTHNLWKEDFSEAVDFPTEYELFLENTEIGELMSRASSFIKEWLESRSNENSSMHAPSTSSTPNRSSLNLSIIDAKSWQNLISNNIQHKALVSLLSVFILKGKTEKQFETKRLGLIATDLYFMLLAISGSQVFHIFNPILYSHAVENLKICNILTGSTVTAKPVSKKKKGRHDDDDFDDEEEGNDSDGEGTLVPSEKANVIKMLVNVLSDLHYTLKKFQLKGQDDSLLITIQILILITRLERNSMSLLSKSPAHNSISYLSFKSFKILLDLFCPDHGEVQDIVRVSMREIMSSLLIFDQKSLKMSAKEVLVVKDNALQFIRNLLRSVKDPAYSGIFTLLQHLCIRIPDKADLRAKGVQVVMELLDVLPYSLYSHSVVWIMTMCLNDQVKHRVTALEIVTKLLYVNERIPTSPLRPINQKAQSQQDADSSEGEDSGIVLTQQPDFATSKFLLGTILSRCQDVASSVRAKALAILANLISSSNASIRHEMESIFVTPYLHANSIETSDVYEKQFLDFQHFLKNIRKETNANVDPLPGAKAIISLLELFVEDEKVFVRKSALQVLANIFLMNEKWMSKELLELMVENCRDMSVSVRKLLVQCLTDLLLHYPSHPLLPKYWVLGVLPLLADQELKSQEKVLEAVRTTILDNLVAYNQMRTDLHNLPWVLLAVVAEHNKRKFFLFACHKWSLEKVLKQSLITIIKTHIGTENNIAAWYLLASFSEYLDIKDPQFVLEYFYDNVLNQQQVDEYCCQLVTEVMHLSWRQLPDLSQITLCDTLLRHLAQFTVPLPMISRCIDICQLITETHADSPEQARDRIKQWAGKLLSVCESGLEKEIGPDSPDVVQDETRLSQYIFTVGDTAQVFPAQFKHSVLLLIQNLLTGELEPRTEDGKEEKRWRGCVSAGVQAVAVVTLGKLCLQREHTAKVLVPLFGSLLSETPHAEIKINAMIALTDMCIKFTSLVEKHLPEMCICLRDKELEVRENTLTLMIQLVQEDYLKLRCPMFFHLLTTLGDEAQLIRDMTSSFIINSLLVKQKNVLVQHFVEGLFHYNAYTEHSTYSKGRTMSPREIEVFCLSGAEGEAQRRHIFRFMLEHMMDDHRFKVTYRLCTDILAGVAEGEIELSSSGTTLLQDALYVLSSEEIRLAQLRPSSKDGDDDDDGTGGEMAQVAEAINNLARKTLVSQVVKKNMIENIVPIFIKLKHKLMQIKSPLVRDLMACLRELMKDYKTEINDILAADKELATEILHDLQNSGAEEEDEEDNRPQIGSEEILKKAVMEVVALNEARKSLNMSKRTSSTPQGNKSKRLSTSPPTRHTQSVSPLTDKTPSVSANNSPPGSSEGPPQMNGKHCSPSSSSAKSDSPCEPVEVRKSLPKQRSSRHSTSSTSSEVSSHSKSSKTSGRTRKKR